ncbi:Lrp/AsnC family transcriptional regulator [Sulfitobacter geojensis]|uniref:Lrp/AsnC family transcriptional regulator n=1 Tax=Sulfitobacter geojensis TaxID=1342299 RepID=UPI0036DAB4A5
MDDLDKKILRVIQKDGSLSTAEIGRRVGITAMPVWRRIKRMETAGIIQGTVVLVDAKKVGLSLTAYVMLRTNRHDADWFEELATFCQGEDAIVEFHRLSGDIDFLLKVLLADMDDYQAFYRRMIAKVSFMDVSTTFAFEATKQTTAVPIDGSL